MRKLHGILQGQVNQQGVAHDQGEQVVDDQLAIGPFPLANTWEVKQVCDNTWGTINNLQIIQQFVLRPVSFTLNYL